MADVDRPIVGVHAPQLGGADKGLRAAIHVEPQQRLNECVESLEWIVARFGQRRLAACQQLGHRDVRKSLQQRLFGRVVVMRPGTDRPHATGDLADAGAVIAVLHKGRQRRSERRGKTGGP